MALNFPSSPSNLQEYDEPSNGIRYVYHASKNQWRALAAFATGEVEAQIIDDISSNFNNNAVGPFQLKYNGANIVPFNEQSVLITINGLVKTPVTDYTINSTGQLTFTAGNGPATAAKFSGIVYSKIPLTVGSLTVQGGTMSGDITFNSTQTFPVEGVQTATTARYGVTRLNDATDSTSDLLAASSKAVKTTKDVADAALPKAGGTMTGDITFNSTQQFDGRDLSVDGSKLDGIDTGAKDDQTAAEIKTLIATSPLDVSHLAADSVDTSEIKDNAVTTAKIADAELTTLAGMQSGTASNLASGTALTATTTEINAICDDKSVQTTISDTDAAYPTSGAVVDYVAAQIAPLGGLEVIANEDSFPTQPSSGVVISIADAGGIVVNGSGVSTTARTSGNGSDNVTINGFPSTLYSTTLTDNMGLLVSSTGSSNTYTYHKLLGKESDIKSLSDDINDFNNRYRIASSAPSSSLDDGDLWFDTTNNKMKVYNASGTSWDDVAAPGNFFINTLSSSSGSGGGSATFNGTATRFTLSSPPAQGAQQCIVSVNGVIQKPNSGTSPSEGFAVDGNDIIFAAAPATSSPFFIITIGNSVNIGTPSDNTVSTVKIQNLAVSTDKIAADAVTGAKIADNAINSEHYTDGSIDTAHIAADQITGALIADDAVGAEHIEVLDANLQFADNAKIQVGTGNDLEIFHDGTNSWIKDVGTNRLIIDTDGQGIDLTKSGASAYLLRTAIDGAVELYHSGNKKFETYSSGVIITGNCNISGNDDHPDNSQSRFGTSNDLQIYHDGSNSYINESGTGDLIINSSHIVFQDGGTEVFESTATGARFKDSKKLLFGSGNDLEIFHDGSHSYIKDVGVGSLRIDSNSGVLFNTDSFTVNNSANSEAIITAIADGAVSLYHDGLLSYTTATYGGAVQSNTTTVATKYKTSEGTTRGWVYANNADNIGFLTNSGSWAFRLESDKDYMFYGNNISDRDRKDNITTVTGTSLDKITKLVPKTYNWKATDDGKTSTDRTFTGFIAQEVKEHLPSLVTGTDGQKNMAVDYNGILAHAVKAITELSAEVETLKTKVAALEAK